VARDYKDNESRRGGYAQHGRKSGGLFKGVLLGILLSLLLAGALLWLLWPRSQDFNPAASAPELQPPPAAIVTPAKPADAGLDTPAGPDKADAPNYTFYDILPGDRAPKPLPAKPNVERWWLQVAALKNASDADALRAKLALLNFSVVVEPTTQNETMLYRVRVGPFSDQAAADSAQKKLAENKFEARPLKEAVNP